MQASAAGFGDRRGIGDQGLLSNVCERIRAEIEILEHKLAAKKL
tara:strand:- start:701 stop:832 length:132 start_codon:yes stop_codon:yes gene_type:complete